MATKGTWVEYDDGFDPRTEKQDPPTIVRPFSSELAASRSALANGNLIAFVDFGLTIAEALHAKRSAEEVPPPPSSPLPKPKGRPIADTPQA